MRNFIAKNSNIAVSANAKETAFNSAQAVDTSMLMNVSSLINLERRRETNIEEMSGREEQDTVYKLGNLANAEFAFDKMQPQHLAFAASYALGVSTPSAAGTGYQHTITPMTGLEPPSFTAVAQYGGKLGKRRFTGLTVDGLTMSWKRDGWISLTARIKGSGKYDTDIIRETISVAGNVTSIEVSEIVLADDVENVHQVRGEVATDQWTEAVVTSASVDNIGIESLGVSATIDYDVTYRTSTTFSTNPNRVEESPLRITDLICYVGGKWNGTAIVGGRQVRGELDSFEWTFNNNNEVSFIPDGAGDYADEALRGGRDQSLAFNRQFRDMIYQEKVEDNDTLCVSLKLEGAEFDTGHKFTAWVVFPLVGITDAQVGADGRKMSEAVTFPVLEDATYGSVIVIVKNEVDAYAA